MAKPAGFLEYRRKTPLCRQPEERIKDWREFQIPLPEEEQRRQGARCMDCGIPFCHSGVMLGGMVSGCPLNNLIPEWNELIYRGLWKEAAARLFMTHIFPEFTGRVCPAPCEGSCTLGFHEPPVTIKANELAIAERAFRKGWAAPKPPRHRSGKEVAVVGSGPAGLAAAHVLNRQGHRVTVYERDDRPGGLLMYGIPSMKLEKEIVLRRLDLMEREGVHFRVNTEVGRDLEAERLCRDYDALLLCGGASTPRGLTVKGSGLQGIHYAVDYLTSCTRDLLAGRSGKDAAISARGKDVVVIGGGDTGNDCAAVSLRQGCKSLAQFEILPPPPRERLPSNPWPQWPRILKTDYGQEEAGAVFGRDPRVYGIRTCRFSGDEGGHVRCIHTVRVAWDRDARGKYVPRDLPGTEKAWPARLVLLSMGFVGAEESLFEKLGLAPPSGEDGFHTNREGIFIAGDMRSGPGLVVRAIREGMEAAGACHRYLAG